MKPKRIKPMGRSVRLWSVGRIIETIIGVITMAFVAAFIAVLLLEWLAGCGETYVDASGKRHANQCLFFPLTVELDKE